MTLGHRLLKVSVLVFISLLSACTRETEEDRVRKVVAAMQEATEEKELTALQEHISRSYRDPQGNDYEAIKGLFTFYFFRHRTVGVSIPSLEVSVNGPQANAKFTAVLSAKGVDGEPASMLLPDALGAYDFDVSFRKEDGSWTIVSATRKRTMEGAGQP